MDILGQLKLFYNTQTDKFHNTRKREWPEFDIILKYIKKNPSKKIKILELWCWDWRFYRYLQENLKKQIQYTWIDISNNLINIALQNDSSVDFQVQEMIEFLKQQHQEQYDFVIWIASFQHLFTKKQRHIALRYIYRSLKYWWDLIMINWSFSKWFISKHKFIILKSLLKTIFTLWLHSFNDLFVPWKDKDIIFYRYYHIFLISELKKLIKYSWFIQEKLWYVDSQWEFVNSFLKSRNTFLVAKKDVID